MVIFQLLPGVFSETTRTGGMEWGEGKERRNRLARQLSSVKMKILHLKILKTFIFKMIASPVHSVKI